jgi:hypothetical protein
VPRKLLNWESQRLTGGRSRIALTKGLVSYSRESMSGAGRGIEELLASSP